MSHVQSLIKIRLNHSHPSTLFPILAKCQTEYFRGTPPTMLSPSRNLEEKMHRMSNFDKSPQHKLFFVHVKSAF